jgi:hypothetical protein
MQQQGMYRECPHCREPMRREASVCPHCRRESRPMQFHEGRWWSQVGGGRWYYLDETTNQWVASEQPAPPTQPQPASRSAGLGPELAQESTAGSGSAPAGPARAEAQPSTGAKIPAPVTAQPSQRQVPYFFGDKTWLHVVAAILTGGLWLLALLSTWFWRRGRRRAAAITAVGIAALVLAVALGSGSSDSSGPGSTAGSVPSVPTPSADSSSGTISSSDSEVASWASDVVDWSDTMASAMSNVSDLIDQGDYTGLAVPLATIRSCSATLPSAPSSSAVAQEIENEILDACGHYERGASLVAEGIDSVDASKVNRASSEWVQANAEIDATSRRIRAFTSSG